MKKHSAGILVYRIKNSQTEVLIAHMGGPFHAKKDAGHWSIPKGEYDEGEEPKAVARREFGEELGKQVPEGEWQELGIIEYKNGKRVSVWAVEGNLDVSNTTSNTFDLEWPPRSGNIQQFPEIDRAAWFSLSEAASRLIPAQAEFLQRLAGILGVPYNPDAEPRPPSQASLF